MYGRGVAVSKSDTATYCFALLALESVAEYLGGAIKIHVTYDEEVGGMIGPKWLLDEGLSKPDLALSAGLSYAVVTAHNSCLHLEVSFTGRSAHAADPASDADALEAASVVLAALYEERRRYAGAASTVPGIGHPNLVVSLIEGGINTNVVPDKVVLRLDRRMVPEEDPAAAEDRPCDLIERAADGVAVVEVAIRRVMLARPSEALPGHERLVAPGYPRGPDSRRRDHQFRRTALYRRAALRRTRHPDRALWRGPAEFSRSERPPGRREAGPRRSGRGNQGGGAGPLGPIADRLSSLRRDPA